MTKNEKKPASQKADEPKPASTSNEAQMFGPDREESEMPPPSGDGDLMDFDDFEAEEVRFADYEIRLHAMMRARLGRPVRYRTSEGEKTIVRLADQPQADAVDISSDRERRSAIRATQNQLIEFLALAGPSDHHQIDELAADLFAQHTLLGPAIEHIRSSSQLALNRGASWFAFHPLLIVSPPGLGKTSFVRSLAAVSGLPVIYIDCSLEKTVTSITSGDSVFGTSRPSALISGLVEHKVANILVVLDEIDKLTDVSRNASATPSENLIGLVQRETAKVYRDSHLQMTVDLSYLNFIFLANDLRRIAVPLRDRVKVVQLDPPTARQIADIAAQEVERRGLDPGLVPILRRATATGKIRSLRKLHKLLDAAQATKSRPLLN